MQPLEKTLRNKLEHTVMEARDAAEAAARGAVEQLGVGEPKPYAYLSADEKELRRRLRTHGRQLGDFRHAGKAAHEKHDFRAGMKVSGLAVPVPDPRLESAGFYKTSGLKVIKDAEAERLKDPPFRGVPPDLETYRSREHRHLDARTYESKCSTCIWGCRMPVEMIIDHWNPSKKRYRFETFCYGPKSCSLYRPGPMRKVPGRKGMSYTEEGWVDEDATSHRGPDD